MTALLDLRARLVTLLESSGDWVALLPIRLLMAWEFGRAGLTSYLHLASHFHFHDTGHFYFSRAAATSSEYGGQQE